jgi:predicted permease
MSIWTKSLTSPQTDERVTAVGRRGVRVVAIVAIIGALAFWTYLVRGIHDYCYRTSAWSDGASRRAADDWTPYIVLWFVPVLLATLVALFVRASVAKKKNA